MEDFFKFLASMPTGGSGPSVSFEDEGRKMLKQFEKMSTKMEEKMERMKKSMQKSIDLPIDVKKLLTAARIGNHSKCSRILAMGIDVNSRGAFDETALCGAAAGGHVDLLNLLASKYNADVNTADEDGDTPLIYAVIADELAFIKAFLSLCGERVQINAKNKAGKTGIEIAFRAGNEKIVKYLSKMNAIFECKEKHKKVLFKYAREGKSYFIQFWFDKHPEPKTVINMTWRSRTLALTAALNGNLEVIKVLDKNGANLDIPDEDGDTPMFCAAQNGFDQVIKFLVSKGCDLNHRNKAGRTPISSALRSGNFEIVRYLYNKGANLTIADKENSSLLLLSVASGLTQSFKFICEHLPKDCLQFNEVTIDGETCLLAASQTSNVEIFNAVIDKTGNLDHRNKLGVSAALRAAYNSQIKMVELLKDRGANLDLPNYGNETTILCATQKNNLPLLQLLLNTHNCNVSIQDFNGHTLVYYAVKNKNMEMLNLLIKSGAPVDKADVSGNTPFMVAVNEDCVDAVKQLFETGRIDVNWRNTKGHTAVLIAVNNESEKMLKYLTDLNCETDVSDRSGDTPLLLAIKKKLYRLAKLLATKAGKECDPNAADKKGTSCLHAAALTDSPAFVTLLCGVGANLEKVDNQGRTPFANSASRDSAFLSILSAKGSDVNRRNAKGQNAAHLSVLNKESNLVVLEALGCCIDAEDFEGNTPIHLAAANGQDSMLDFLIERGVSFDLPNREGNTPVHLACKKGSFKALSCLLEHKAKLKGRNNRKQTELMLACKSGKEKLINLLLPYYTREDINMQDSKGKTALHYAVKSKHKGVFKRLIEAGAEVNIPNNDSFTPVLLAAQMRQWSVVGCALDGAGPNRVFLSKLKNGATVAHFASGADIETLQKLKENSVSLTELTGDGDSCLTLAASKGSIEACDFLLSEGNLINHCNNKGESAVCKAAQQNHSELFFYLANQPECDFLRKDGQGNSSLYYFLEGSETLDHSAISELLSAVDEQELLDLNSQGLGICHIAAKKDNAKLLRSLQDREFDLKRATRSGETCITLAARASGSKALKFLLENSRTQEVSHGETSELDAQNILNRKKELLKAFHILAELGKTDLMDELLSIGIDVNDVDEEGNSALMIACQHKQEDFATSLLSKEVEPPVDVDKVNQKTLAAIHYASRNQLADCVKQLIRRGARTDIVTSEGYTCLHETARGPDSTDVAELLIDSGCDIDVKTYDGETSLLLALKNGSWRLTKLLIRRGATVDVAKIPLCQVVKKFLSRGRRDVINWLLELEPRVDVNKQDADSRHVLFDVIDHGAEEILRLFISKGANIECEDNRGVTPFLHALIIGREDLAKVLIEHGCDTKKRASNGFDCAMIAVSSRRLHTLKWLFANIPELKDREQAEIRGKTALHLCCEIGHPQMFKLLIEKGYDLTKKCDIGWTPLDYAVAKGHLVIMKAIEIDIFHPLTDWYTNPNSTSDSQSPPIEASANGYQSVFQYLYLRGTNMEKLGFVIPEACLNGHQHIVKYFASMGIEMAKCKDHEKGKYALQWAIHSGNLHLIKFLIEKHMCDIRAVCLNRNTAIQGAVATNQERILNYLINKGAPMDEPDAEGDTPVLEAALLGYQRMLEILLDHHCDIQRVNNQGRNAVHMAVIKHDNPGFLKYLIDKGVPADAKDGKGNTACMIACYQGHKESVKLLLEHKPSLGTERNADGSTPAILAAMTGKHEVLQILADNASLSVDDADKDGSTILMMAIQSGSVPTVKKLLEVGGSNLEAVNNNGISVQMLAGKCRDEQMVQLLMQHGIRSDELVAADESGENQQTNQVGYPIELIVFTPDRPAREPTDDDDLNEHEEHEDVDAESQSTEDHRSAFHNLRREPTPVSDGSSINEPRRSTNQAGSLISAHTPSSVATQSTQRAQTIASANVSDIRHDPRSVSS